MDGGGFGGIVGQGAGAVGTDVADFVAVMALASAMAWRMAEAAPSAWGWVMWWASAEQAEADDLGVDGGVAGLGGGERFRG